MLAPDHDAPSLLGVPLKTLSLFALAFHSSLLYLLMHYSRVMPVVGGHRYLTSTAIFVNEVIRLAICLTLALYDISRNLPSIAPATSLFTTLYDSVLTLDSWKLAVPAALYTLQNFFLYLALSHTNTAAFQVSYQLKILTAAIFSVVLLRRTLLPRQWLALVLLLVGVGLVQMHSSKAGLSQSDGLQSRNFLPRSLDDVPGFIGGVAADLQKRSATYEGIQEDQGITHPQMNALTGFLAIIAACVLSGLAGVYSEKFLKDLTSSLWIRNVQLSFYSLFPALLIGVATHDAEVIAEHGLFHGYNAIVWAVIGVQAVGTILTVLCMNSADSLTQSWATCLSIVWSFFMSLWLFEVPATGISIIGTCSVLFATFLFSRPVRPSPPPINIAEYEKTTIGGNTYDEDRLKPSISSPASGLSTSRPSSPIRHHSRIASGRTKFAKRGD